MAVVDIKLDQLKIHPKNIRKEYEGIEELAQSIRENGIMQNLTVVPDSDEKGKYLVIIGNRRLTAAREAGIEIAPCVIIDEMEEKEQIATMLTENMNRKDLKIYEESAAIQMCFTDFGIGIDEIEKKTGLSKTTINRRLNIAKLDEEVLKGKAEDAGFQLNLMDLYLLEKVESIETRNKILKEARDSSELANKARFEARNEKIERNGRILSELCKKEGIKKAPQEALQEFYTGKWEIVERYMLDEKNVDSIEIDLKGEEKDKVFYLLRYSELCIVKRAKKEKKELSKEEVQKKEKDRRRREMNLKYKDIFADMGDFIRNLFDGKMKKIKDDSKLKKIEKMIWELYMCSYVVIEMKSVTQTVLGKEIYAKDVTEEDKELAKEKAKNLDSLYQKIACAYWDLRNSEMMEWNLTYKKLSGEKLTRFYDILSEFGYSWPDEESEQIANGTHELYEKIK